jgi:hypothetical protein
MRRSSRRGGVGSRRPGALLLALERRIVLDAAYFPLSTGSLIQDWEVRSLLSSPNSWANVESIEGFRGDGLTGGIGVDPQTILGGDDINPVESVEANRTNPNTYTTGGVAEFEIATPIGTPSSNTGSNTVALQGSGTADAPYLRIYVNNAGRTEPVRIRYDLIDIDGSTDNAVQSVALQYRLGSSGNFTNVPAGFVADASAGPSLTGAVNSIDVTLPANTIGASEVQIRIITSNAVGDDELIAIDNIRVFGNDPPVGQFVFDQDSYSVNEDAGTVTVNVLRTDPTTGSASVQYQTLAGSALSGSDYEGVVGTLSFASGESIKPITLTLIDDEVAEANEFFTVGLFNASGAGAIGNPSFTTITILDDDIPPAPAVFLNEIVVNPPDADGPHEYIEIKGPAGLPLTSLYFVSIEGEGGGAGLADLVIDLSPYAIGANGLLMIRGATGPDAGPDTTVVIDTRFDNAAGILENGSNSFALFVSATAVVEGSDLDLDNDGTLDLEVGTTLVDGVGSRSINTHRVYGAELVSSVPGTVFGAMSRIVGNESVNDASAWYGGLIFDPVIEPGVDNSDFTGYDPFNATANLPAGAVVTPGAENYVDGSTLPGTLYPASGSTGRRRIGRHGPGHGGPHRRDVRHAPGELRDHHHRHRPRGSGLRRRLRGDPVARRGVDRLVWSDHHRRHPHRRGRNRSDQLHRRRRHECRRDRHRRQRPRPPAGCAQRSAQRPARHRPAARVRRAARRARGAARGCLPHHDSKGMPAPPAATSA